MAIATVLRVWRLDFQSLWLDEAYTVSYAGAQTLQSTLEHALKPGENGPLYFFIMHHWLEKLGSDAASLRAFSVVAGIAAVPLAAWAYWRVLPSPLPLILAFAIAVAPYQVWYAQEGRMYTLVLALSLLGIGAHLRGLRRGRSPMWWAVSMVALWAAIFSHLFAVLLAVVLPLYALIYPASSTRRTAGIVLPGLSVLVFVFLEMSAVSETGGLGASAIGQGAMIAVLLYAAVLNVAPFPVPIALVAIIFLMLAAVYLRWPGLSAPGASKGRRGSPARHGHRRPRQPVPLLWLYLRLTARRLRTPGRLLAASWGLPVLVFVLLSFRVPLFADRYFIWTTPALYGLLATGVIVVARSWRAIGALATTLVVVAVFYGLAYGYTQSVKSDFRTLAQAFDSSFTPGDGLIIVPSAMTHPFRYYAKQPAVALRLPTILADSEDTDPAQQLRSALAEQLRSSQRVWLVIGDNGPGQSPYTKLIREELGTSGALEWGAEYAGDVALERYRWPA